MKKILLAIIVSLVTYLLSPSTTLALTNLEFRGRDAIVSSGTTNSYNITRVNIVLNGTVINGGSVPTNNAAYQTLAKKLAYIQALKARLGLNH